MPQASNEAVSNSSSEDNTETPTRSLESYFNRKRKRIRSPNGERDGVRLPVVTVNQGFSIFVCM